MSNVLNEAKKQQVIAWRRRERLLLEPISMTPVEAVQKPAPKVATVA